MQPELFHWRLSWHTMQPCMGLGILPVPLVPSLCLMLGLLLLELQLPSSFCFLLIIDTLLISPQGPKAWLPENKITLLAVLCCIMFILLSLKSKCLKAHWRYVNSFVSSFALCLPLSCLEENIGSRQLSFQECNIQPLIPLPPIFLLSTLKS